MENKFRDLGVEEPIIKAIEEMGFEAPTRVQEESIPPLLKREDLIVMSKTGSGKTGAFGIPIIQLVDSDTDGPQALILTPTRELAVQVDSDIKLMSKHKPLNTTAVYGQHSIATEIQAIKKGASIVVGTPGRVFDHIQKKTLPTRNIKFLVLDEADRMLDMGFIDQVVKIIKALPRQRVTLLFSATMPSEIQRICKAYMNNPTTIELESDTKTVDSIQQLYYRVEANDKRNQLDRLIKLEQPESCLVFCNTRYAVDKVQTYLARKGFYVDAIHGANSQSSRMKTIEKIKKGEIQIVVATDVAARGLHIDDLNLVINYDVPMEKDSYVHRIGRTGRAGNTGKAITIVTTDDIMSLYEIEEHVGALIEETPLPTDEAVAASLASADGKWAHMKAPVHVPRAHKASPHPNKKITKTEGYKGKPHSIKKDEPQGSKPHHQKLEGVIHHKKTQPIKPSEPKVAKHIPPSKDYKKPEVSKNVQPFKDKVQQDKPKVTTPKVKTETVVLPKLGAIEFRTPTETKKKKTLMDRISGIFKG